MSSVNYPKQSVLLTALAFSASVSVTSSAPAQDTLPVFSATAEQKEQLGEEYTDEYISVRPPAGYKKIERPNPPELVARGVQMHGWSPSGEFPSISNFNVTLTPFAEPSAEALDKTVESMLSTLSQSFSKLKVIGKKSGKLKETEVRIGKYTAEVDGREITGMYLVGIDSQGTFSIQSMTESAGLTKEGAGLLGAALLTFERAR